MNVPVTEIVVGERRREDMGDIGALAASIDRYGLIHPIVVDERHALIAGGRRLAACKKLGWEHVEVRYFVTLTDAEKREIELEENIRRKDLTPLEQSKDTVRRTEVAVVSNDCSTAEPLLEGPVNPASEPNSLSALSARTGIPETTIHRARAHVAAAEKYPELADLSQKEAIQAAKMLDAIPDDLRPEVIADLHQQAKESVTSLTRVRQFADLFLKYSNFMAKVQGEDSNDEIFADFDMQQAEWFVQQTDEVIETFQSWRATLCQFYPQLKTKGLRRVH